MSVIEGGHGLKESKPNMHTRKEKPEDHLMLMACHTITDSGINQICHREIFQLSGK